MERIIGSGAEAVILLDKNVVKDRIKKNYRISEIDDKLRKSRTKREAKILKKLEQIEFPSPRLIKTDDLEKIEMEFIGGKKLRDILNVKNYRKLMNKLGEKIAVLHNNGIIHGDLTTSNFLVKGNVTYFIDFGLSFFDVNAEHKAVDLHLLKQALESKHFALKDAFQEVLKGYQKAKDYAKVMERFEKVESRGRYKTRKKS
ncbi:MAG TPA: KEOPS complex kinase/ATPase Bud32 [Candidatus Nanoarchaeia archaeon]|nr:KEOPS complex kinase/ATPase Bud32 [Candidatus Nanoarchaeia archaeon]